MGRGNCPLREAGWAAVAASRAELQAYLGTELLDGPASHPGNKQSHFAERTRFGLSSQPRTPRHGDAIWDPNSQQWMHLACLRACNTPKMGTYIPSDKPGRENVVHAVSAELAFSLPVVFIGSLFPQRRISPPYLKASKPHTGCFIRKQWESKKLFDRTSLCCWKIALGSLSKPPS